MGGRMVLCAGAQRNEGGGDVENKRPSFFKSRLFRGSRAAADKDGGSKRRPAINS